MTNRSRRSRTALASTMIVPLVLAACGGGDSDEGGDGSGGGSANEQIEISVGIVVNGGWIGTFAKINHFILQECFFECTWAVPITLD